MFELIFVAILGLSFGSFASALIHRIPRNLPWVSARSECTSCNKTLKASDLIPVLSWLMSKGKCSNCGASISALYPALEILSLALCLLIFFTFGDDPVSKYILIASVPILLSLIFIDLEHKILPNSLVLMLGILGLIFLAAQIFDKGNAEMLLTQHLGGALLYAVFAYALSMIMTKILKKEALGFGDVKFFGVAGLWLGISNLALFCIFSGVLGVVLAIIWKIKYKEDIFPFGPALIGSLFLILMLESSLFVEKAVRYMNEIL